MYLETFHSAVAEVQTQVAQVWISKGKLGGEQHQFKVNKGHTSKICKHSIFDENTEA